MRLKVKKWGNGLALRLPRESVELGRLEEGMELDADFRPVRNLKNWKPHTFDSGIPDLSQKIDEIMADDWEEKVKLWRSSTRVS